MCTYDVITKSAEVHNVSQCCQRRIKLQATCTENLAKFVHLVFRYTNGQTDRDTGMLIAIVCTPPEDEVITYIAARVCLRHQRVIPTTA